MVFDIEGGEQDNFITSKNLSGSSEFEFISAEFETASEETEITLKIQGLNSGVPNGADFIFDNLSITNKFEVVTSSSEVELNAFGPNPVQDEIMFSRKDEIQNIRISSIDSRIVYNGAVEDLNVSLLKPNLYIIEILYDNEEQITSKLIKR